MLDYVSLYRKKLGKITKKEMKALIRKYDKGRPSDLTAREVSITEYLLLTGDIRAGGN